MITVGDLITQLQTLPPTMPVSTKLRSLADFTCVLIPPTLQLQKVWEVEAPPGITEKRYTIEPSEHDVKRFRSQQILVIQ